MSYISIKEANALVGETFTQEQLNAAQQIIHRYSGYRWEATDVVKRFTSDGIGYTFLDIPVTALTYLYSIDEENDEETELDRFDDYNYDKRTGKLEFTGTYTSSIYWVNDFQDFEVSYTYGFESGDEWYADSIDIVKSAEARLALLYKKNPLRLKSINLGGDTINFNDAKKEILTDVPRRLRIATYDTKLLDTNKYRGYNRYDRRTVR